MYHTLILIYKINNSTSNLVEGTPKFNILKIFENKLSILPSCCYCQPMKFISNLSTHVFVIIIKFQEKTKPVKWSHLNLNLNGQNFAECKNQDFM